MTELAISKITKELGEMGMGVGNKENMVKKHVADALIEFCKQDAEFAQAVMQTDKNLGECCTEIMKGCDNAISDIEVYRKAVQFYFPGAGIKFSMTIDLCASVNDGNDEAEAGTPAQSTIDLELTSFL